MNVAARTEIARYTRASAAAARLARVAANRDVQALSGLALLLAALAALSWRKWGVPTIDAGHELTTAAAIVEGAEPYRDIRYFYGPAGVYSLAGAFELFGIGFGTAFAFGLLQATAIVAAFYALARQLLPVLTAFLAAAVLTAIGFSGTAFNFVLPHSSSATFGLLFLLLMLLALSRRRLVLAGLAAGVIGLTRPEFAAVAGLAGLAFLVGEWRQQGLTPALRALPCLALPALAVAGTVLGFFAWSAGAQTLFTENLWPVHFLRYTHYGSQSDWAPLDLASVVATAARALVYCSLLAAVVLAASGASAARTPAARLRALWALAAAPALLLLADLAWGVSSAFPGAREAVQEECAHLVIGMSWLPALGLAACLLAAVRLWRGEPPPLSRSWGFDLALIVAAAALGARAYDAFVTEASYAPYYAAPLVLLLAVLHQRLGERWPSSRQASLAALAGVAVGLTLYSQVALYPDDSAAVHTARGTFVTTPRSARPLQRTIDFIRSHTAPGEPILAAPSDAGIHFMTDRPAALYNVMFLPGQFDSRTEELAAAAQVRRSDVHYAIVSRRRFVGYGHQRFGVDYDRPFASALLLHRVAVFGTPGPTPGGTTPSHTYVIYRIGGGAG
jgi:hypothetical protein